MTDCSDPQCGVCRRRIEDPERGGVWVCSTCFDVPETIDGYVGRLKRALRGSITTRRRVAEEVRLHLEELAASETDAVDQVDAERRATQRMGSPETLAAELPYRRWKPWIVVAATILCGVAGFAYSAQQQTLYGSTSAVLYLPNPGTTGGSSTKGIAGEWGVTYAPFAESTEFAALVLHSLNPPIPGLTSTQLQNHTTVVSIPAGDGLEFTVSDAKSLDAQMLANAYSREFPVYLAAHTPNPTLQAATSHLNDVRFKIANAPVGTPQTQIIQWKTIGALYEAKIKEIEATTVPTRVTSTVPHSASAPVQTQPNTVQTIAVGALIGFLFGTVLMLIVYLLDTGAPSPPRAVAG